MNPEVQAAIPELEKWIGRKRVVHDEIGLTSVQRAAATLDTDPSSIKVGDPIPRAWFNMFFPDICRDSEIGPDGHPHKGVFLPPIPLPRRMGAGRRVQIMGNLVVGQPATKTAEVAAILPKSGRSGNIVILTMRLTFETAGAVIAVDEFDAIYREAVPAGAKSTKTEPNLAPQSASGKKRCISLRPRISVMELLPGMLTASIMMLIMRVLRRVMIILFRTAVLQCKRSQTLP